MTITEDFKRDLYAYIHGIIKNKQCYLHRINGIPNHLHLLIDIHPAVAIATLVKDIKQFSNRWIRGNSDKFPMFDNWGEGYYAVSVGANELERCKEYIKNQESHHSGRDLLDEMKNMAEAHGLAWYADDWT